MTATRKRLILGVAGAGAVGVWTFAAVSLWRTSVPHLQLGGLDEHRFFTARQLSRARSYGNGADVLWVLGTLAQLIALAVLVRRAPRFSRGLGLGAVGSAIVVGMVVLVTLWFVGLPFGLADLWWQHHWGLGPFDPVAWLLAQDVSLPSAAISALAAIAIAVGLAVRLGRWWWVAAAPAFVAIAALFAFLSGWLAASGTHPVRNASLRERIARIERVENVHAPVRVLPVHQFTHQANAFTVGFGPSTHLVLWDTLLDGRFTPREMDVVVAHELGHVESRHIPKTIAWLALVAFPFAFVAAESTRRRGGLGRAANLPLAFLAVTVAGLLAAPLEHAVSRRYEAEADWRALNATHDPVAARQLFANFANTSLEQPDPPLLDYLWLENHPTLMQRIAMTERYRAR